MHASTTHPHTHRSYGDTPAAYFWLMDSVYTDAPVPDFLEPFTRDRTGVPREVPGELPATWRQRHLAAAAAAKAALGSSSRTWRHRLRVWGCS